MTEDESIRIDQWLWAARFFKTRSLAKSAVESHKIKINSSFPKPSRSVRLNDTVTIDRQGEIFEVQVVGLSDKRLGAERVAELYFESEESKQRRQEQRELQRLARLAQPQTDGRPTKRERRQIHQFKNKL